MGLTSKCLGVDVALVLFGLFFFFPFAFLTVVFTCNGHLSSVMIVSTA